jgi:hypothetical protein
MLTPKQLLAKRMQQANTNLTKKTYDETKPKPTNFTDHMQHNHAFAQIGVKHTQRNVVAKRADKQAFEPQIGKVGRRHTQQHEMRGEHWQAVRDDVDEGADRCVGGDWRREEETRWFAL